MPEKKIIAFVDTQKLSRDFNSRIEFDGYRLKNPQGSFEIHVPPVEGKGLLLPTYLKISIVLWPTGDPGTGDPVELECNGSIDTQDILHGRLFDLASFGPGWCDDALRKSFEQVVMSEGKLRIVDGNETSDLLWEFTFHSQRMYTDNIPDEARDAYFVHT